MAAQNVERLPSRDNQWTPQNLGIADEVIATPLICQEEKSYMYLAAISCVLLLVFLILIVYLLVKIKIKNGQINEMVKNKELRLGHETEGCSSMPIQPDIEIEREKNSLDATHTSKKVLPRSNTQNMNELLKN